MYGFGFSMLIHLAIVIIGFIFELLFRGKLKRIIFRVLQFFSSFFKYLRKIVTNVFLSKREH